MGDVFVMAYVDEDKHDPNGRFGPTIGFDAFSRSSGVLLAPNGEALTATAPTSPSHTTIAGLISKIPSALCIAEPINGAVSLMSWQLTTKMAQRS